MNVFKDVRTYSVDLGDKHTKGPVFEVIATFDGSAPAIESVSIKVGKMVYKDELGDVPDKVEMYDYLSEWTLEKIMEDVEAQWRHEQICRSEELESDPTEIANRLDDERYHRMVDERSETLREVNARRGYEE